MKFQIILVRHGETRYNKDRIIQGQLDVPLNDKGKAQAAELGKALSSLSFFHIYSSDLQRAKTTCEILLSENSAESTDGLPQIQLDRQLRERTFGCMEGKSVNEMINACKAAGVSMADYVADGSETVKELKKRAKDFFVCLCHQISNDFLSEKIENNDVNVLVVTHGGFIKALFSVLVEEYGCDSAKKGLNTVVSNASQSCVEVALSLSNNSSCENPVTCKVNCLYFNAVSTTFS